MAKQAFLQRWAPIPLRLIVGYGFLVHGLLKLGRGADVFAAALGGLGVPAPHLMAWITDLPSDHEFFRRERNRWIESLAAGSSLLAVSREGRVLGFAASGLRDDEPYLDQLSVRTQFMRRGVGTSLLNAVQRQAIHAGGRVLWLTTYGHLPWNRPFYERAGFAVIDESRWGRRSATSQATNDAGCPVHSSAS